jgi:hypothetical protein
MIVALEPKKQKMHKMFKKKGPFLFRPPSIFLRANISACKLLMQRERFTN